MKKGEQTCSQLFHSCYWLLRSFSSPQWPGVVRIPIICSSWNCSKTICKKNPSLKVILPNRRNLGTGPRLREAADRQQLKRTLAVWGHSCVVSTAQGRRTSGRCGHTARCGRNEPRPEEPG